MRCKDDGVCHHGCKSNSAADCFRQQCCVPLTCSGFDDQWHTPAEAAALRKAIAPEYVEYAGYIERMRAQACPVCDAGAPTKKISVNALHDGKHVQISFSEKAYERIENAIRTVQLIENQAMAARRFKRSRMFYRRAR